MSCIKASLVDEVKETLQQHYANVLKRPPPPINDDDDVTTVSPGFDSPEVTGPIMTAELCAALSTYKLSSSGTDGILVITLLIEEFEDDILDTIDQLSLMVDSEYSIPSQWKHSIIVSIPRKGSSLSL